MTVKTQFVEDAAELYDYYPDGTIKDMEAGDLRTTLDTHGNYTTWWHFEGGEWIFKKSYDRKGRLVKQVALSKNPQMNKRIWNYRYDASGILFLIVLQYNIRSASNIILNFL